LKQINLDTWEDFEITLRELQVERDQLQEKTSLIATLFGSSATDGWAAHWLAQLHAVVL
jgi:hypothetical protein